MKGLRITILVLAIITGILYGSFELVSRKENEALTFDEWFETQDTYDSKAYKQYLAKAEEYKDTSESYYDYNMRLANFTLSSIKNEYEKYKKETENYYVYKGETGKFITLVTGVPIVIVLFITAIVLDIFIHIGAKHYMREAEKYSKEFSYYRRHNRLTKEKLAELTEIDLERIIDFEKGYELPTSEEKQRINFILKIPPQSN